VLEEDPAGLLTLLATSMKIKMFTPINQITTGTIRLIPQPKSEGYGHSLTEACFGYPFEGDTHSAGSDLIDGGKTP